MCGARSPKSSTGWLRFGRPKLPSRIFSKPTARTTSCMPAATARQALRKASMPDAQ